MRNYDPPSMPRVFSPRLETHCACKTKDGHACNLAQPLHDVIRVNCHVHKDQEKTEQSSLSVGDAVCVTQNAFWRRAPRSLWTEDMKKTSMCDPLLLGVYVWTISQTIVALRGLCVKGEERELILLADLTS